MDLTIVLQEMACQQDLHLLAALLAVNSQICLEGRQSSESH